MRLLFLETGQVVSQEGIEEDEIPAHIFQSHKNSKLFPSIEEAKIGKVREFVPPVKKLIPTEE